MNDRVKHNHHDAWLKALALLLFAFFSNASHAAVVSLSNDLTGLGDDLVTAVLTITDIGGLGPVEVEAMDLWIEYDPSLLDYVGARAGSMFDGAPVAPDLLVNATVPGMTKTSVTVLIGVPLVEGGELFEADFRIRPDAAPGSAARLDLSYLLINEEVEFHLGGIDPSDGVITVVPIPPALWLMGGALLALVGVARRRGAPSAAPMVAARSGRFA